VRAAAAAWAFVALSAWCAGQTLFDPPALPPSGDSGRATVRGLYDPAGQPPIPSGPIGSEAAPPATMTPPEQRPEPPRDRLTLVGDAEPAPPADSPAAAPLPSRAQPIEGSEIVAKIDGQVILASDVLWQVHQLLRMARSPIPKELVPQYEQMLMRQLMMGMLDTKILYADFCRTVPAENLPKINETLQKPFEESEIPRLMEMLNVDSRKALDDRLVASGTSLKDVQRQFVEKQIAQQWLKEKMPRPEPISYEVLWAYYQDHPKEYEFSAKVKWEELMVRFDRCGGDRHEAWRQICEMGNEVYLSALANPEMRGPAFAATARQRSHGITAADGGFYDWMELGSLRCEAINEALATLAVGQMSPGIESEQGFHIVRVLDRKEAGRVPFTEAQAEIRTRLENEQRITALDAELKRLRLRARAWTIFEGDLSGPQLEELLEQQNKRR
jgi:hypothetical protein